MRAWSAGSIGRLIVGCTTLLLLLGAFGLTEARANPSVSFAIPLGQGVGQIAYVRGSTEPWGPISFCVLESGDIAVLDAGNKRIQVFNKEGSFRYEVDISKASISPVDLREWMGGLRPPRSELEPQLRRGRRQNGHRSQPGRLARQSGRPVAGASDRSRR